MKRSSFLYNLLYGRPAKLRPYEQLVMRRLDDLLPHGTSSKLHKQLEILCPRRQTEDRVLLYSPEDDKAEMDPQFLFGNASGELLLASGELHDESPININVKVFAYFGRLSSIQFARSPRKLQGEVSLSRFQLVNDPEEKSGQGEFTTSWSGVVRNWAELTHVSAEAPPLNDERRKHILDAVGVQLPGDYLEAVFQAEGLDLGVIKISGLSAVGANPLPDGELITLAQVPDGLVGVISPTGQLVHYDGCATTAISGSFGDYVSNVIRSRSGSRS